MNKALRSHPSNFGQTEIMSRSDFASERVEPVTCIQFTYCDLVAVLPDHGQECFGFGQWVFHPLVCQEHNAPSAD